MILFRLVGKHHAVGLLLLHFTDRARLFVKVDKVNLNSLFS